MSRSTTLDKVKRRFIKNSLEDCPDKQLQYPRLVNLFYSIPCPKLQSLGFHEKLEEFCKQGSPCLLLIALLLRVHLSLGLISPCSPGYTDR